MTSRKTSYAKVMPLLKGGLELLLTVAICIPRHNPKRQINLLQSIILLPEGFF
jgi:hypothetical protein